MANHIAALEAALIAKDLIAKNPQQDRPLMVLFEEGRESGKGAVGEKIMNVEISGAFWITVILEAAITSLEMANHIAALEAALIAKDLIAKNPQQDRPLMVLFEEAMAAQGSKNRERLDVLRHMLEELRSRNPQPVPPAAPPVN